MIHKFSGKLVMPERNNADYEFGIYNQQDTIYTNLTDLLNKLYMRDTDSWAGTLIDVKIKIDVEYVFDSVGEIYRDKDEFGVYDWFIGNDNLGKVLFDLCGFNLNIIINDNVSTTDDEYIEFNYKRIMNGGSKFNNYFDEEEECEEDYDIDEEDNDWRYSNYENKNINDWDVDDHMVADWEDRMSK